MFRKVLVANRGEIAVRVIRALRELEVSSVAVFSEVDRKALHVLMADEAVCIGPAASSESYLAAERIFEAVHRTGAEAIHPGYGFLSENAAFARECENRGIKFIGPSSQSIAQMGSKTAARKLAAAAGTPIVPGTDAAITSTQQAERIAEEIGYPILLKAAAGGGGKGMRRVDKEEELPSAMRSAADEAKRAFGSSEVYLEKLIAYPRHIEVQVIGDEYGHLMHLGERECSIQRRHQKVIEESPSPLVLKRPELRQEIGEAALRIAGAGKYFNAGTLEFIADQDGKFYFLEMNTRLQVEHPVTEMVTGLDLVHWQLRIAAGEHLTLKQDDIEWRGSAIECRIYAEDPANNFFPSPGRIAQYTEPGGPGVRIDGGVYSGWNVPIDYDPLLAKLVTWAETRESAIKRMQRAISEYHISGITTNIALFSDIMADPIFREGKLHTGYLEVRMKNLKSIQPAGDQGKVLHAALLASVLQADREMSAERNGSNHDNVSLWRSSGRRNLQR